MSTATAFPLVWPEGWKRTPAHQRTRSRYKISGDRATEHLFNELKLMGAKPERDRAVDQHRAQK